MYDDDPDVKAWKEESERISQEAARLQQKADEQYQQRVEVADVIREMPWSKVKVKDHERYMTPKRVKGPFGGYETQYNVDIFYYEDIGQAIQNTGRFLDVLFPFLGTLIKAKDCGHFVSFTIDYEVFSYGGTDENLYIYGVDQNGNSQTIIAIKTLPKR
jgi:hypothetical protein